LTKSSPLQTASFHVMAVHNPPRSHPLNSFKSLSNRFLQELHSVFLIVKCISSLSLFACFVFSSSPPAIGIFLLCLLVLTSATHHPLSEFHSCISFPKSLICLLIRSP
jgi:hypothetical protein